MYQDRILDAIIPKKRVAVRGPHGLGKTAVAAWLILWAVLTHEDVKVPCTASKWRQLTKYLFPEIHKWAKRLDFEKLGRPPFTKFELMVLSLKVGSNREAFALASNDPAAIEGAHADFILYVYDEAKTIPAATFDATEGAFAGAGGEDATQEAYALVISTPADPSGRFYDIHSRAAGYEDWTAIHVTLEEAIAAGRISKTWAEARKRQWGEESAIYQNRVLGEFASSSPDDIVVPLSWIQAAVDRWTEWKEGGGKYETTEVDEFGREVQVPIPKTSVGVDVGRGGDKTVLAPRWGHIYDSLSKFPKGDTMATVGRVRQVTPKSPRSKKRVVAIVDVIGIGAGVVDRLRELGDPVFAFNASAGTKRRDSSGELEFLNLRAAALWGLREKLNPELGDDIFLPDDPELIGDLSAPRWTVTSAGKVKIESKVEIIERIGRSPDAGDAVVMTSWDGSIEGKLLY